MGAATDLTNLDDVKAWIGITTSSEDDVISAAITAISLYWLWRTGRDSLNSNVAYNERYDGSGTRRQFLRNVPVTVVSSVTVDGVAIPETPDFISYGWALDRSGRSISLIGGGGWQDGDARRALAGRPPRFTQGVQNVQIQYTAGYSTVPPDVEDAVKKHVAVAYKRRQWIDQESQQISGIGVVKYRGWEVPPEVERTIRAYARRALP